MDPNHFTVVAGQETVDRWDRAMAERVAAGADLCRQQFAQAADGREGVEICPSLYGWSVRYDSGLQNFGLLASARSGSLNGTRADAIRFATLWVSRDPINRYAWMRKAHETMDDRWPYGNPEEGGGR